MLENQYAVQCKTLLLGTLVFSSFPQIQFPSSWLPVINISRRLAVRFHARAPDQIIHRYPSRSFNSDKEVTSFNSRKVIVRHKPSFERSKEKVFYD